MAALLCSSLHAQLALNPSPTRVIGHATVNPKSVAPNLVEGREFSAPHAIAVDSRATPPILYVSDSGNNRVLAWRDISKAREGVPADLVIGQRDKLSTTAWGPGTSFRSGLTAPTGLAVDAQGNLYVVDTANNRILRFPKPFEQPEDALMPDFVIGQSSLNTNSPNAGGISASTMAVYLGGNTSPYRTTLVFDSQGNLYFTDAGNHRVLRYPAYQLAPGMPNGPPADLVLGQVDFLSREVPKTVDLQTLLNKNILPVPAGLAVTSTHLYVSDGLSRVLVFPGPPFYTGQAASRFLGVLFVPQGQPAPTPVNETQFNAPEGLIMLGGAPAVCDLGNNRILLFDSIDKWAPETATDISPKARAYIGQKDFFSRKPGVSATALSGPAQGLFFNNELWVADSGNNRVVVFPQQSASPPTFPLATRVVGQLGLEFNAVNLIEGKELFLYSSSLGGRGGVAVDNASDPPRLYLADSYNNRVLGFRDARRIKTGDKADLVIGQPDLFRSGVNFPYNDASLMTDQCLFLPTGLAVDANGDLWVADSANSRVLRFPKPFSQSGMPRANLVLGQSSFTFRLTDASARTLAAPFGLAFTAEGHLLVSDFAHHRVLMFRKPAGGDFSNGQAAAAKIGQPDFISVAPGKAASGVPAPLNRLSSPRGIALDSSDRLYVCDAENNRVLIFPPIFGLTANDDPSAAVNLTGLRTPQGLFVSQSTGEIWVANTGGNQALRYPHFDQLPVTGYRSNYTITSPAPLALTLDSLGNLLVADGSNRVAIHFPVMVPVNAASFVTAFSRPLTPGLIATLYPTEAKVKFGTETKAFDQLPNPVPLPRTLGDIQVFFNDEPAPLYYVSPGQINFLVPMKAPSSGAADMVVMQASTGQVFASVSAPMGPASPALFTANATGSGLVAALNQDNSVNTPASPVGRGEIIQLFGTGQGFVEGAPADGEAAAGQTPTQERPRVWIEPDYVPEDHIVYSGLAPGLVGVWQINVKVPDRTAPGQRIIFLQMKSINSSPPQTRIMVK